MSKPNLSIFVDELEDTEDAEDTYVDILDINNNPIKIKAYPIDIVCKPVGLSENQLIL